MAAKPTTKKSKSKGDINLSKSLRTHIRRLKAEGREEEAAALWKAEVDRKKAIQG